MIRFTNVAHWLRFVSYGLRIGVAASSAGLLARARARLPPGRAAAADGPVDRAYSLDRTDGGWILARDRSRRRRATSLTGLLDAFESELQLEVAQYAPDRLFVHAGVVGWRGRAIVLPGRSFSGKSTLVAALVRAGATYYSDEYAVLDARGRVHPYARRLSLRRSGRRPRRCTPESLGGRSGTRPLPVGRIVLCRYRAEGRWAPQPLSTGRAVLALLKHTVAARARAELSLARLSLVAEKAQTLYGVRGEARRFAESLLGER